MYKEEAMSAKTSAVAMTASAIVLDLRRHASPTTIVQIKAELSRAGVLDNAPLVVVDEVPMLARGWRTRIAVICVDHATSTGTIDEAHLNLGRLLGTGTTIVVLDCSPPLADEPATNFLRVSAKAGWASQFLR